jgi:hypothetical protein
MVRHIVLAVILLLAPATARAAFIITVTEGGGPTIPIVDGGVLDIDGVPNGAINVLTPGLNALLTDFSFTSLSGMSDLLFGTPFSTETASLSLTGQVVPTDMFGTSSITIVSTDDGFLFPAGSEKFMRTSASDTFAHTTAGDSRTFQATFDATGSGGGLVNSPLLAFIPPVGPGSFSTSNPGVDTPLGVQPNPYSLSVTTVITLGPNGSGTAIPNDQFTGATVVSDAASVPEPGSVVLMGLGLTALGVVLFKRAYTSSSGGNRGKLA